MDNATQCLLFLLGFYFLPTLVAAIRRRPRLGRFFVWNLFGALLPFGYIVLLWKALHDSAGPRMPQFARRREYTPTFSVPKITFTPVSGSSGTDPITEGI
jgi:hypothetical protein